MASIKSLLYGFVQKRRQRKFLHRGSNVAVGKGHYEGKIEIGSNVSINTGAWFVATRAKISIHDNVVMGPHVTIYTGSHVTSVIGKHICEIANADKELLPDRDKWDKDVVIESGCYIGTNVTILRGVTIGRGSVVGAGAVVTKSIPPYSVYVGTPPARTWARFSPDEVAEHEKRLGERGVKAESMTYW